jgi:ABC-type nitrate/sulfonate/bicarbonate transport system substrate-binding protein
MRCRAKRSGLFVGLSIAALTVAGCSSSNNNASSSPGSVALPTLTVALPTLTATHIVEAVAEQLGYFKAAGVNVKIVAGGANIVTLVTSGQADLGEIGMPSPLLPAAGGKQTSVVFGSNGGGFSAQLAAQPGVASVSQCKQVATTGVGTSAYNWTVYYKKALNLNYNIITQATETDAVSLVVSKQADCVDASSSGLASAVSSGRVKLLLSPQDPATLPANFPTSITEGTIFGMTSNLNAKATAVVAYMKARLKAVAYIKATSPDQVAKVVLKQPGFNTVTEAVMAEGIKAADPYLAPDDGAISEADWSTELSWIANGGTALAGGATASTWTFSNRVNPTYVNQAESDR